MSTPRSLPIPPPTPTTPLCGIALFALVWAGHICHSLAFTFALDDVIPPDLRRSGHLGYTCGFNFGGRAADEDGSLLLQLCRLGWGPKQAYPSARFVFHCIAGDDSAMRRYFP